MSDELQLGPYPDGYRVEILEMPQASETRG
jgi:hypothetical protein